MNFLVSIKGRRSCCVIIIVTTLLFCDRMDYSFILLYNILLRLNILLVTGFFSRWGRNILEPIHPWAFINCLCVGYLLIGYNFSGVTYWLAITLNYIYLIIGGSWPFIVYWGNLGHYQLVILGIRKIDNGRGKTQSLPIFMIRGAMVFRTQNGFKWRLGRMLITFICIRHIFMLNYSSCPK